MVTISANDFAVKNDVVYYDVKTKLPTNDEIEGRVALFIGSDIYEVGSDGYACIEVFLDKGGKNEFHMSFCQNPYLVRKPINWLPVIHNPITVKNIPNWIYGGSFTLNIETNGIVTASYYGMDGQYKWTTTGGWIEPCEYYKEGIWETDVFFSSSDHLISYAIELLLPANSKKEINGGEFKFNYPPDVWIEYSLDGDTTGFPYNEYEDGKHFILK